MSLFPTYGVPMSAAMTDTVSRDLFELDVASIVWSADTGTLTAASGQTGTWSRSATLASVSDALGATYTAQNAFPAFEQRDWNNDGVREAFGWRMATTDRLAFPTTLRPMAMAGLLEIIETGARTVAGSVLFAIRNDAATGAGLFLDTTGSFYRLVYTDGTTTRLVPLTSGAPVAGDRVQFTWGLTATGVLTFNQSINGAAATTAVGTALALPTLWGAGAASIRLNSESPTTNAGQAWYRRCRVVAGALNATIIVERR